jgi:hypothetical protein
VGAGVRCLGLIFGLIWLHFDHSLLAHHLLEALKSVHHVLDRAGVADERWAASTAFQQMLGGETASVNVIDGDRRDRWNHTGGVRRVEQTTAIPRRASLRVVRHVAAWEDDDSLRYLGLVVLDVPCFSLGAAPAV